MKTKTRLLTLSISIIILAVILTSPVSNAQNEPVLDHFNFDQVGSPQTVEIGFWIRITAVDQYNNRFSEYSGLGTLSDYTGITTTAVFRYGISDTEVKIALPRTGNVITVNGGGATGKSNQFDVNPASFDDRFLDHFYFDPIGNPQTVNAAFAIRITAVDQYGNLFSEYSGSGTLSDYTGISTNVYFTNGISNAEVKIGVSRTGDEITVNSGGKTGKSNQFNISSAPTSATPTSQGRNDLFSPPTVYIIAAVVVVIPILAAGAVAFRKRSKKGKTDPPLPPPPTPTPAKLKVTLEPTDIVADGKSKSIITIQLLDNLDNPISALTDTPVNVTSIKAKLEEPTVVIPKGKDTQKAVIISTTQTGPTPVSVGSDGLKSITITLNLIERIRYCMHCGTIIPVGYKVCKNCGKAPPAGLDTKSCQNCQAVIPVVAKFCSECGAGQQT